MAVKPTRAQVPVEETWRLEDMFATTAAWEAELTQLLGDFNAVAEYKGHLGEGARTLLACLELFEGLRIRAGNVFSYASLNFSTDGTSQANQMAMGRVQPLMAKVSANAAWIQSELLALPDGRIASFLAAEPGLAPFKGMLEEVLAMKPHVLSPETESVLATFGQVFGTPSRIFQNATAADMKFEAAEDSKGEKQAVTIGNVLMQTEHSPDTTLRRNAWASLGAGLAPYQNLMAENLGARIRQDVLNARVRKYNSVFDMLAYGGGNPIVSGADGATPEFFNSVLDIILTEMAPHMRRLARLRKELLGLKELFLVDGIAPLPAGPEARLPWEQACTYIREATAILGPEYQAIMNAALTERWIDRAGNSGRAAGAFCNPVPGVHPYVFSEFGENLRTLFILIHELGHAGHMTLSDRYQRPSNNRWSRLFIEAPSTMNELLLARHLRSQVSDVNMRRRALMGLLATYYHNFVTHLLEAETLRRAYRIAEADRPITAKVLGDEVADLQAKFWGGEIVIDENIRLNWMRQPHYFSGLYSYTYSVGLAGATVVAKAIETEGQKVAERWVEVLKAGASKSPVELFKMAGVDMTTPEPIRQACAYVGSLVDELEATYK